MVWEQVLEEKEDGGYHPLRDPEDGWDPVPRVEVIKQSTFM